MGELFMKNVKIRLSDIQSMVSEEILWKYNSDEAFILETERIEINSVCKDSEGDIHVSASVVQCFKDLLGLKFKVHGESFISLFDSEYFSLLNEESLMDEMYERWAETNQFKIHVF